MVFEVFVKTENVPKEERYYVLTYFRAQEYIYYLYIFVFSAHIAIDNLLRTLELPAVPNVIMASNKSPDLINVVNKNRKLAALLDGTLLFNPRILKAFLLTHMADVESDHCSSS